MSIKVSRHPGHRVRVAATSRAGFLDGMASVFRLSGRGRPAPILARRRYGSCGKTADRSSAMANDSSVATQAEVGWTERA